jgi:hypothetical protein
VTICTPSHTDTHALKRRPQGLQEGDRPPTASSSVRASTIMHARSCSWERKTAPQKSCGVIHVKRLGVICALQKRGVGCRSGRH